MIATRPQNRPDMAIDLTRWNRAALHRFQYVDGDAAVWLEELRIALLGLYLRGGDPATRTPESWRDLFSNPDLFEPRADPAEENQRLARLAALRRETQAALVWQDLLPGFPDRPETSARRNLRLLEQYAIRSPDYGWEIMRAFARAAHVLLGYLDAYTNEGYLRTATQWDNVRRLAATVNYQPAPPASATAMVALILDEAQGGATIERGLGMKYTPLAGGPPLIFETIEPVQAHPDLNAAHAENWNYNASELDFGEGTSWSVPASARLAPGDLAALVCAGGQQNEAVAIKSVDRKDDLGTAELSFDPPPEESWITGDVMLMTKPADVRIGLPRTSNEGLVLRLASAASYAPGSIVRVTPSNGSWFGAVVLAATDRYLRLDAPERPEGTVTVEPYVPYSSIDGVFEAPLGTTVLNFKRVSGTGSPVIPVNPSGTRTSEGKDIARQFTAPADGGGLGYARVAGSKVDGAEVIGAPPKVIPGTEDVPDRTARFAGEPPKGLTVGDWFVARPIETGDLQALQVRGVRTGAAEYHIEFHTELSSDADKTEFFGPSTRTLRPVEYDRSQEDAVSGGLAILTGLSEQARAVVKPGRVAIVDYERAGERRVVQAPILSAVESDGAMTITVDTTETFSGWHAGWTVFRLNAATVSHGETKGSKTLGSGDAERRRQSFTLGVKEVSFIPSTAAEAGVVPDIDVTVNGIIWGYRDLIDPTAEEAEAWSSALNEDDTLQIHFRRRLPSGQNNVLVARHRIGTGAKGTGVPAFSFEKPAKKHRFVRAIVQPSATTGGADREPVADIRINAPARLAANDRAVALVDFERLCQRHSSVWQAKAKEIIAPGATRRVHITIVPANGGTIEGTPLQTTLIDFVQARAVPGVAVELSSFVALPIRIETKVLVDFERFDKDEVRSAAETVLVQAFSLERRALGQAVYVAEVMAALETVDGVSSALVTTFEPKSGAPSPERVAGIGGSITAIFPTDEQVAHLVVAADGAVVAEAAS